MMLIKLLSVKSGMMLEMCVNALLKGWDNEKWANHMIVSNKDRSVPGKYILAGIWVDHGSELGDHNAVSIGVPLVGVALQELTPIGHLPWNQHACRHTVCQFNCLKTLIVEYLEFLKRKQ